MKKSIIYIAGYGRSGSTLLERVLASNENIVATGESCNVYRVSSEHEACSCGLPLVQCPQWNEFFDKFKDELHEYERSRNRHESNWGFMLRSSRHQRQLAKYFDFMLERTGKHVIDSSKTTRCSAFRPFLLAKSHDVKMIHLVKDGRACLASNLRGDNIKMGKGESDTTYRYALLKTLWGWPTSNFFAEVFRWQRPENYIRVRFEDFEKDPATELERIANTFNLDLRVSQQILNQDQVIPLAHQLAGNRMSKSKELKILKRAKTKNQGVKFRLFTALNFFFLKRYGY